LANCNPDFLLDIRELQASYVHRANLREEYVASTTNFKIRIEVDLPPDANAHLIVRPHHVTRRNRCTIKWSKRRGHVLKKINPKDWKDLPSSRRSKLLKLG
jgi:hypothetical protein